MYIRLVTDTKLGTLTFLFFNFELYLVFITFEIRDERKTCGQMEDVCLVNTDKIP